MNTPEDILGYLKNHMPAYPFDPQLDEEFVDELIADFHDLDILEETKTFRCYFKYAFAVDDAIKIIDGLGNLSFLGRDLPRSDRFTVKV